MKRAPKRASYGAAAYSGLGGELPGPFPRTMGPNCMTYLEDVVSSGLTCDMIGRFERAFAAAHGVRHCVGTPGCTPALAVLASAFDFEPGDEVVVSPITDYGTVQGLVAENYIPVFADTAPGTVNVSAETIAPCITDRTRAILVVHKTGLICDMDPINELAGKHDLIVYEDACQAVFGEYKGRLAGTLSSAGAFSFDSEKTMGSDRGGCIITDDDDLAGRCRFVGQSRGGKEVQHFGRAHVEAGYAYRMSESTAAITLAQLEIAKPSVADIDGMARLITGLLAEIPGITPLPIPEHNTVYSAWMLGFSIEPKAFSCAPEDFARQTAEAGLKGAGLGRYYLMPEALTFLHQKAERRHYPYSQPPASRTYVYDETTCPTAHSFLQTLVRWSTFCEKWTEDHCHMAANMVRKVADRNRR